MKMSTLKASWYDNATPRKNGATENSMADLTGQVAVVTGASRGIGKGTALELGAAGSTVYVTGRTVDEENAKIPGTTVGATADEVTSLGGVGIPVRCDHSDDDQIEALFERVRREQGRLDILVNNVFSVPDEPQLEGKFWELPVSIWDQMFHVGCRSHYVSSRAAAPMMIEQQGGLIINISSFAGATYVFNLAYSVGKAAVDRLAKDMAVELRPYHVTCVSFWPGVVRTEYLEYHSKRGRVPFPLDKGETPRFTGRAAVALATDPKRFDKTGQVLIVSELGLEYGFKDIDGRQPGSLGEQMGMT
jgi:NAD(P)-dependent dehydrogenase (short-subunit alcohol dehydrogenase family)